MTIQIPASGKVVFGGQSRVVMRPSQTPLTAEGGNVIDVNVNNVVYRTHIFTSSGILTVTSATDGIAPVEYLVVGGGGGGGGSSFSGAPPTFDLFGGGGGGGGFLTGIITLGVGDYSIVVGGAGAGGVAPGILGESANPGSDGTPSSITISVLKKIESFGGGYGGAGNASGNPGGSGGGGGGVTNASRSGGLTLDPLQGNPGGAAGGPTATIGRVSPGGGGGGADTAGGRGLPSPTNGIGGKGKESSLYVYPQFYSAGGGGGPANAGGSGIAGGGSIQELKNAVQNTGSGGGGGLFASPGGNGSGGIVIIRYRIT